MVRRPINAAIVVINSINVIKKNAEDSLFIYLSFLNKDAIKIRYPADILQTTRILLGLSKKKTAAE